MRTTVDQDREPPPAVERDPREDEAWFVELPESAKQDFRRKFADDARREAVNEARRRDHRLQAMIEGVSILLLVELLVYGLTFWSTCVTLTLGIVLGVIWQRWSMGRAPSALIGVLAFFLVRVLCGMGDPISAAIALLVVSCGAAACAIQREGSRIGA